jgi:hypothetical protein
LKNFGCDFRIEISLGNFVRGVCNRGKKENPNFSLLVLGTIGVGGGHIS